MGRMAAREEPGKKGLSGARTFTKEAPLSEYTLYVWMAAETPANSQQKHLQAHVQRSREHNRPVNQNKICIRKEFCLYPAELPCGSVLQWSVLIGERSEGSNVQQMEFQVLGTLM